MAVPRRATHAVIETRSSGERQSARNRRAVNRIPVRMSAVLIWDGSPHGAWVTDLGMGGLFATCPEQPGFGTTLTVVLAHWTGELRLPATVRWNDERGFGAAFGLLGARETYAVAELLQNANTGK